MPAATKTMEFPSARLHDLALDDAVTVAPCAPLAVDMPLLDGASASAQMKPCPHCANLVQFSETNQAQCAKCKRAFGWRCSEPISDVARTIHYQWWNPTLPRTNDLDGDHATDNTRFDAIVSLCANPYSLLLSALMGVVAAFRWISWTKINDALLVAVDLLLLVLLLPLVTLYLVVTTPLVYMGYCSSSVCCIPGLLEPAAKAAAQSSTLVSSSIV